MIRDLPQDLLSVGFIGLMICCSVVLSGTPTLMGELRGHERSDSAVVTPDTSYLISSKCHIGSRLSHVIAAMSIVVKRRALKSLGSVRH